jgi:hypothetical protein
MPSSVASPDAPAANLSTVGLLEDRRAARRAVSRPGSTVVGSFASSARHRGSAGKLAGARIYDDADPPLISEQ